MRAVTCFLIFGLVLRRSSICAVVRVSCYARAADISVVGYRAGVNVICTVCRFEATACWTADADEGEEVAGPNFFGDRRAVVCAEGGDYCFASRRAC